MLREKIKSEMIVAMKAKDEAKTSILRMINATIKDKDIAARPSGKTDGITDDEILGVLQSMIKQRKESIELYKAYAQYSMLLGKVRSEFDKYGYVLNSNMK